MAAPGIASVPGHATWARRGMPRIASTGADPAGPDVPYAAVSVPVEVLPVRLHPLPGEALESFAGRLARANRVNPSWIWAGTRRARPTAEQVVRIAALSGCLVEEVAQLDPFGLPAVWTGSSSTGAGGWMVSGERWGCGNCLGPGGECVGRRDWAFVVHPVCRQCGYFLVTTRGPAQLPSPVAARRVVEQLAGLMVASRRASSVRALVADFRSVVCLVALTLDLDWPPPRSTSEERLRLLPFTPGGWGTYLTPDPVSAAVALVAAAPALRNPAERANLVRCGWMRLASYDLTPRHHGLRTDPMSRSKFLPEPPEELRPGYMRSRSGRHPRTALVPRAPTTRTMADGGRLRARLIREIVAHGVFPRHVNGLAYHRGEDPLPARSAWPQRQAAAQALQIYVRSIMGDPGPAPIHGYEWRPRVLARALLAGEDVPIAEAVIMVGHLRALIADGLVDHRLRHDGLHSLHLVPERLLGGLQWPEGPWAPEETGPLGRLAAGWIWVHFTRTPTYFNGDPELPMSAVLALDRTLTPDQKLTLVEYGTGHLDAVAGDLDAYMATLTLRLHRDDEDAPVPTWRPA